MTVLWIDASQGAAGDMLLAALLDAGADAEAVRAGLARLEVEPLGLDVEPVRRHGLRATHVTVRPGRSCTAVGQRRLVEVLGVIDAAGLPETAAGLCRRVFAGLAAAEGRVHGIAAEEVHFHEVGALDAIADVVGCALALDSLGLPAADVVVSPVAVGAGAVITAHGVLPVPVPAVLDLLTTAGAPIAAHPGAMELCTPTGAALLTALATRFGPVPACTPRAYGVGAGTADPPGHPNVLRLLIGDAEPAEPWRVDDLVVVETTIDDLDPRLWPDVLDALHLAGARDAWCTPVLMRKGRPGHVLTALAEPEFAEAVCLTAFTKTTTLGVRLHDVRRRALARDRVMVAVEGAVIPVKRGLWGGAVLTVQPEYDDVRAAAAATGRAPGDLLDEARVSARKQAAPQ